jgi:hypothetical protein
MTIRPSQRACSSQPVVRAAIVAVDAQAEDGEQRPRHPEGHRHQVDGERAEQRRLAADEAQPGADRAADRLALLRGALRRLGRHRDQRGDHRQAAHGVGGVGRADAEPRDQQPAEARADDHRELVEAEVEGQRAAQPAGSHEVRDDRGARHVLDRAEAGEQAAQDVEQRERRVPGERAGRQPAAQRHEGDLVEQQQAPPVHPVGDRPAEQRHEDERAELDRSEQTDQERRPGLHVELVGQRHQGGLRPHPGDEVAHDEPPQVGRLAHRRGVDGHPGEQAAPSAEPGAQAARARTSRSRRCFRASTGRSTRR